MQLQINYADWENPSVAARANYEVAREHGKSIVVMEPVKGLRAMLNSDPSTAIREYFSLNSFAANRTLNVADASTLHTDTKTDHLNETQCVPTENEPINIASRRHIFYN